MSTDTTRPRIAVVQHQDEGPRGLLEDWAPTRGARLDVARPDRGELPDLGDADALVVLGSEASAIPHEVDWIDRELVWLARMSEELPVLGICSGAQALAVALAGVFAEPLPGLAGNRS